MIRAIQVAAEKVTRNFHALSALISAAFDDEGLPHQKRPIDTLNNALFAGAMDAISYLASLAKFFVSEASRSGSER